MQQRERGSRAERVLHRGMVLLKLSPVVLVALVVAGVLHASEAVVGALAVLLFAVFLAGEAFTLAGVHIFRREVMGHLTSIAAGEAPQGFAGSGAGDPVAQEDREQAARTLAEMSSAPRHAGKQLGLVVVGAFSFAIGLISFGITATTDHLGTEGIGVGIGFTLGFLILSAWCMVVVVRMVREDHRRHQQQAAPLVAAIEERNRRVAPRRTTILRVAPLRWLVAELVPFGFLAIGVLPGTGWHPIAGIFVFIGLFVGAPFSVVYLYKVHGAPGGWVLPLIVVYVGSWIVCGIAVGDWRTSAGESVVVTRTWLVMIAVLLSLLAVVVAAAVLTGERWVRRNQLKIAPTEAVSRSLPYGNRGISSWRWLPRQPDLQDDGAWPAASP